MTGRTLPGNRWDLLDAAVPEPLPRVSVIVSHYRQPGQLARTLAALAGQTHPRPRVEVIVADDGSPEPPVVPPGVRVVSQPDRGFRLAAVRNLGAAHATGDVLVFLDADTVPEPGFLTALTRMPALAPDVVTVGRRRHADLTDVDPSPDIRGAVAGRQLEEPRWLASAYRDARDLLDADDRSYRHMIGAVLCCARGMFDAAGGFDESFDSYGGEDWEWAYRAWRRGAVFAHVADAVAWHDGPDAGAHERRDREAKNREALRLAQLIPVPGSRPHGIHTDKVDVAVAGPDVGTEAQRFVSLDSVLAALPGSEEATAAEIDAGTGRFDRVRLRVELLRPVHVCGDGLASAADRVAREDLGVLTAVDATGGELLRLVSERARIREARWGRDDLFDRASAVIDGVTALTEDVDLEAYLGGWMPPPGSLSSSVTADRPEGDLMSASADHDDIDGETPLTRPEDKGAPVAESHIIVSERDGITRLDVADDATMRPGPGPGLPEADGD
ncbi:glycosyltransferase [Microbacterium telephonicum]|uniref:GT2 family glycosyltransferase n=1 Tax=Microbacterium telephonicum TaxID=1714841 RepID=A0A498C9A2_9MICO|nr:glycosyltransferase [Microbacterium telephonicum]RLK52564.1 GT2 family glycosyltransferase [Microbacterium telephonicum]